MVHSSTKLVICSRNAIYKNDNYIGSLLLCKAIPVNSISIHLFKFAKTNSLNKKYYIKMSINLDDKIQDEKDNVLRGWRSSSHRI